VSPSLLAKIVPQLRKHNKCRCACIRKAAGSVYTQPVSTDCVWRVTCGWRLQRPFGVGL